MKGENIVSAITVVDVLNGWMPVETGQAPFSVTPGATDANLRICITSTCNTIFLKCADSVHK